MTHPILKVHSTSEFEKSFRKLPLRIQDLATKKDKWFQKAAFDPRLYTHKLKGELEGYWSYFIYGGERRLREGDIEILPIKDALKELPKILSH